MGPDEDRREQGDGRICNCHWTVHDHDCPMREDGDEGVALDVLAMMMKADNECHDCAGELAAAFVARWPQYRDMAIEIYGKAFDRDLADFLQRAADRES